MYISTKEGIYEVAFISMDSGNTNKYYTIINKDNVVIRIPSRNVISCSNELSDLCEGFYIDFGDEYPFDPTYLYVDKEKFLKEYIECKYHNHLDVKGYGLLKVSGSIKFVIQLNEQIKFEII